MCLSVTLLIVDPWHYCACCISSGGTRFTLLMVLYLDRIGVSAGYTRCSGCTPVHLCTASLQDLAVPHDFGSLLSVPLERSLLTPCSMVWDLRVSKAGPMLFYWPELLYPYYSLLSVYWWVLWGWGLRTDRVCITLFQPCNADLFK